jgi:rifampicin phosphotransferase
MKFIAHGLEAQNQKFGGKVRALAALKGIATIPAWFALAPEAFTASNGPSTDPSQFRLHEDVIAALEEAMTELCPNGELVAVRSSAADEDGAQHSFAGQLETRLNVAHKDVPDAVLEVWRSAFSERLLEYRRTMKLADGGAPAVLIQQMVNATSAGVAFSADPVTGESVTVIAAVPGLGESLVNGERDGDTYRVKNGQVEIVATPEGGTLTESRALEIARLAAKCEANFGCPQDIEWAFENSQLFLLQSRPITTIPARANPTVGARRPKPEGAVFGVKKHASTAHDSGELAIWDNSNIIESYSGMTTPLTYSFARRAYTSVYRQFLLLLGVSAGSVADNSARLETMIGLVRGRIYYNLSNWYRLLALLPGFTLNRALMEQMMGVNEALPPELEKEISTSTTSRFQDGINLARASVGLIASLVRLEGMKKAFYQRLEVALAGDAKQLERMSVGELVTHYRRLESQLITRWDAPLVNDFFAMVFYGLLRRIVEKWCGNSSSLQNDLIVGGGGMISAEPAERLAELAGMARTVPGLPAILCNSSLSEIENALESQTELKSGANAYLEKFGDRCLDELKLESATLSDEPILLWRSIGQLARLEKPKPKADDNATRGRAEDSLRANLSPVRKLIFNFVLVQARGRVRDRENLRFERTRVFGRARRIFLEIGARLADRGDLENTRDVFWLEVGELIGLVEGTATITNLRALARERQTEFEHFKTLPAPPRRFQTRGPVRAGLELQFEASIAGANNDDSRSGIACSPGVIRGPVRIVLDPRNANLDGPSIIVAERTDPGWILILPLARALLVERGSLLSHSAIVSRELGIPAIVAIPNVTTWLKDGDWVELDGSSGTVKRIEPDGANT